MTIPSRVVVLVVRREHLRRRSATYNRLFAKKERSKKFILCYKSDY